MTRIAFLTLLCLMALPVVSVRAEDVKDEAEAPYDAYYEACGEVEPFDDPSNQHSLKTVKEDLGFLIEDIKKEMAGTPTVESLDKLSQKMESGCLSAATLKTEERKELDPQFKEIAHSYDELMTKVQGMEIPQTPSEE